MPVYNRSNRRVGSNSARPTFLTPHTGQKWFDKTTTRQESIDMRATRLPPLVRTLQHLSNERRTNLQKGTTLNAVSGRKSYKNARAYMTMINPKFRDRYEYEAPWFARLSNHQKTHRNKTRTAHAVEITSSDDHIINAGDSLDRAAFEFASITSSRWPVVQKIVLDSFEWWKETEMISSIDDNNKDDDLDEQKIEKRLKARSFSAVLQGYTCCLGNFRSIPMELALVSGFADQVAALSTTLREDVADSTSSSRLSAVLLQVLFIGLLRHQSVSDFRTLGLTQIGKFAQHPVGMEKLPNLVALSMGKFLSSSSKRGGRDVDGAIRLCYATCIYCSNSSSHKNQEEEEENFINNNQDQQQQQFGLSSIPINCTLCFNQNQASKQKLPQHILESHFPYSRQFMTLSYCWGFTHNICKEIQEIKSAAFLFEMSVIALVSLVASPVPCGVRKRILRSIQLVSASCERWVELMRSNRQQKQDSQSSSLPLLDDSEKWSSACILISMKKLAPVLEMLSVVESFGVDEEQKLIGSDQQNNSVAEVSSEEQNNNDNAEEKEEKFASMYSPLLNEWISKR